MLITRRSTSVYKTAHTTGGLQVCFIHCPDANKAALSVSINAGHYNDPDDCPGIAHLFEHCLFAGSNNYANGNHLNQLLSQNAGFLNAWTSSEQTNVHFDSAPNVFLQATTVLVDMLTRPLFSADGIIQEIEAIDAEFKMRLKDEVRRLYDVHKTTCNPKHSFNRFTVGNKSVYQQFSIEQLSDRLKQHHALAVNTSNMRVTIVLPMLEEISQREEFESALLAILNDIPKPADNLLNDSSRKQSSRNDSSRNDSSHNHSSFNGSLPSEYPSSDHRDTSVALYLPEHLNKLISVKPIKDTSNAIITFALPNIDQWREYKPLLMLSHLIEEQHEGSLASFLRQQQWISDISAGGGISGDSFQEFSINLKLTPKGCVNLRKILLHILTFCQQMHKELLEHWRICEKASQLALQSLHNGAPNPIDEAVTIAARLHEMSLEQALTTDALIDVEDKDSTSARIAFYAVTGMLTQRNMRVFYIHPNIKENDATEQYKVAFCMQQLNLDIDFTPKRFNLPLPNIYMPNLVAEQINKPSVMLHAIKQTVYPLWLAYNQDFDSSKGDIYISFEHKSMVGSATNTAIKKLWLNMVSQQLALKFGAAEFAGLQYRLYGHQAGVTLHIGGFAEKQFVLALGIVKMISEDVKRQVVPNSLNTKEAVTELTELFNQTKTNLRKGLQNALLNKPVNQLFFELTCMFQNNTYFHQDTAQALSSIELIDVYAQASDYFDNCFVETLCVGAHDKDTAVAFQRELETLLNCKTPITRNVKAISLLHQQTSFVGENADIDESASLCYFQAKTNTTDSTVLMIFMEKLLSALVFDVLRNKRQLGYLVGCGYMPVNQHPGLSMYVQSGKMSSTELTKVMLDELKSIIDNTALTQSRVDTLKQVLIDQFKVSYTNHSQFAQKQWVNLDSKKPHCEDERLVEGFAKITLSQINAGLQDLLELKNVSLVCIAKNSQRHAVLNDDWITASEMKRRLSTQ